MQDIRSFFGSSAASLAAGKKPAPAAKTESVKSDEKDEPSAPKPSLAKARKRTPAKPKENATKGKKGIAVAKKETTKARQPAKTPTRSKSSRKKRSRDEEEEYDSDFVTSGGSDEDDESEDKPKQKGRRRILASSDDESDIEMVKDDPGETDRKALVNQTITKFVSLINEKHQASDAGKKATPPAPSFRPQEVSSKDFFGASSKPKLVKASSVARSVIPAVAPVSSVVQQSKSAEALDFADDGEMAVDAADFDIELDAPADVKPSVALKENIMPIDTAIEQRKSVVDDIVSSIEPIVTPPEPVITESKSTTAVSDPNPTTVSNKPATKKWYPGQQRAAPKLLGQKAIPKGEPNCLAGKRFVLTGVFESLERDTCSDLIKSLGGAVTTAVSGKTTHLIVGDEPSEKKLDEAKKRKIAVLDEDGLLQLISSCKSVAVVDMPTIEIKIAPVDHRSASVGESASPMWVDKYKPASSGDLCANPGVIEKLRKFLKNWPSTEEGKHAVLLSGPPGIGKSSSAAICAKEAGYNVVELNASTTRSKKALSEHVRELLQCHTISEYFGKNNNSKKQKELHKTVLIMDEVDGMSGGDRGGMQELYSLIKSTKVPIICICNDRSSPKVKTLANYCIDLRFRRPMANQVAQRLLSIAKQEGLNVDLNVLTKLVETTRGDIRQMLNTMQLWRTSSHTITFEDAQTASTKDFENSPFDLAPELFRPISPHQHDWISSRMDVYFCDPGLIPLMVQSNYLNCIPQLSPGEATKDQNRVQLHFLEHYAKAASCISDGDLVDARIRGGQSWSLMPVHAVMSSVAPGVHIAGRLQGRIEFPQWLGKNATYGKNTRLLSELHSHMTNKLLGTSVRDLNLDYIPVLRRRIVHTLTEHGVDGIDATVALMNRYNLTRADLDTVFEIGEPIYGKVALNSKVKASLTRALTQRSTAVGSSRSKSRSAVTESEPLRLDDENDDDYEEIADQEEPENKPEDLPKPVKTSSKANSSAKRKPASKSASTSKKRRAK